MRADIAIGWQNLLRCSLALLEQAYIGKLEENGDAKIQYLKEIVDDQDIEVDTKTRLKDGSEYSVNYKLKFTPAGWRAYDVVVEGRQFGE
jgi:ABC-type transporter MlaC component